MDFMRNPKQVQVAAKNTIAETIVHRAHPVDGSRKRDLLIKILTSATPTRCWCSARPSTAATAWPSNWKRRA